MSQLTQLDASLRAIQLAWVEASRVQTMLANSPHAAPAVIAQRMEQISAELDCIQRHATRAKAITRDAETRSRAVTVCHTRGEPITDRRDGGVIRPEFRDPDNADPYRGQSECAPASSPMAD